MEPLWDKTTDEIIDEFLGSGIKSVIVTTMADVLGPEFIGRTLDRELINSLPQGADKCGENGEYHSLCYDGPIFRHPVDFRLGKAMFHSYSINLDDGTSKEFSYWFANILEQKNP